MDVYHICAWCPWSSEEGIWSWSHGYWALGAESGSSERAASPLNYWAIAPTMNFFPHSSRITSATVGQLLRILSPFFSTFSSFKGHSSSFREAMFFLPLRISDIVFGVLLPCRVSVFFKLLSFAGSSGLGYSTRLWNCRCLETGNSVKCVRSQKL